MRDIYRARWRRYSFLIAQRLICNLYGAHAGKLTADHISRGIYFIYVQEEKFCGAIRAALASLGRADALTSLAIFFSAFLIFRLYP